MRERLQIIINESLMTIPEFARSIEVSQDTIYKIVRGTIPLSNNVINSVIKNHPNISKEWLEKGIGEMFTWKKSDKTLNVLREDETDYGCKLCEEKERYIRSLEDRVEAQKKVIEIQENYIMMLRAQGGEQIKSGSG